MKHRMLRVNEVVKRELSGIIAREMSFGGALVSINHVDVTSDLKNAHVFVSVLGSDIGESVLKKLVSHRATLQAELAMLHDATRVSSTHFLRCPILGRSQTRARFLNRRLRRRD